jgi:hydrogenase nickel incorporation protein HypB
MVVISVTEGDDHGEEKPLFFHESDIPVLTNIDLNPYMDLDGTLLDRDYDRVKKGARLYRTCARTGEGLDDLFRALNIQV